MWLWSFVQTIKERSRESRIGRCLHDNDSILILMGASLFFATFLERILQDLISMFLEQNRSIGNLTKNPFIIFIMQSKGWGGCGLEEES